jgi:hypothetical protein
MGHDVRQRTTTKKKMNIKESFSYLVGFIGGGGEWPIAGQLLLHPKGGNTQTNLSLHSYRSNSTERPKTITASKFMFFT